jgi:hypothetical protein
MIRLAPLAFVALMLVPTARAQVEADPVERFIEVANLESGTSALASQILQMVSMQAGQFPEPVRSLYVERMGDALREEVVVERQRAYLMTGADPGRMEAALTWAALPEVAPLIMLINEASTDAGAQVPVQMYAQTGQLGRHRVTPEREALVQRYIDAVMGREDAVSVMEDLIVASAHFNAMLLATEMPDEAELRAQVRQEMGDQLAAPLRGVVLYALRDIDDPTVEAFAAAGREDGAHHFNDLAAEAGSHAVVGSMAEGAQAFVADVQALDAAGEFDLGAWRQRVLQQIQQHTPQAGPDEGAESNGQSGPGYDR